MEPAWIQSAASGFTAISETEPAGVGTRAMRVSSNSASAPLQIAKRLPCVDTGLASAQVVSSGPASVSIFEAVKSRLCPSSEPRGWSHIDTSVVFASSDHAAPRGCSPTWSRRSATAVSREPSGQVSAASLPHATPIPTSVEADAPSTK
ncbi:MAG: hypothetical protein U0271_47790 [Polyangiaceae bacterium]